MDIIIFIIIVVIIYKAKTKGISGKDIRDFNQRFGADYVPKDMPENIKSQNKNISDKKRARRSGVKIMLAEDSANDFLTRQLAEERAKESYINEMFDLKKSHHDNCEADGVDTGSVG